MSLILALDPGVTTGYAIGRATGPVTFDVLELGEIPWETRLSRLMELIETKNFDVIVMEDFRLYKHAAHAQVNSNFPSVHVIGAVEAFVYRSFAAFGFQTKIVFQPASVRQNVKVNVVHVDLTVGKGPHVLDAYLHLKYYVLSTRKTR